MLALVMSVGVIAAMLTGCGSGDSNRSDRLLGSQQRYFGDLFR